MFSASAGQLGLSRPMRRLLSILVLYLTAYPLRADEINLVAGSKVKQAIGGRVRGQIQKESPSEVVVMVGVNESAVPTDQIVSVRYDGQPATLQLAETREAAGQLAEAADLYKKAAGEAAEKPFVLQAALYHEAAALCDLALMEPDRAKEAKDRLLRFVQAYPNGRHIVAAREHLAQLQLHIGEYPQAEATIAELAKLPKAAELASVLRTRVLAKQGKHAEAISELDRLISSFPDRSVQQREARLAKAESLVALKNFKDAERLVRQVIQEAPPEDVPSQAAAYNTLGDCLREANHPKDALLAYLHTDLLYAKDKEEHPRALYQIEKLFRRLKQDVRADEYAQRLRQEYPRSTWLNARSTEQ
jgi:tetratricopeptide (TPR) repeat protein